ncbi:capsid triplex subunit 1 [Canid alphaherpesvirus 1]|uniref:Capsid triplex subunit 1 n=3 Tax=Canid alphaherpesvirus 1 TaxID=170325 RepID=A0A172DSR6_9ALPH|nr:capsid triplex subunit 1 [Canid alphaherpesvirus 1]ALL25896.1 capsid triplex subunit 1 [Canid alphaherpesvirus 1]ALL25976.1 capsid triplex subunit 1 [Canid alphaherpesvirus 1]ALL26052.1 capsid triplex subunit 1 [Canid alphaherpesvirus 1]AQX83333.1 capsid triplex subunit 1 [Canid alphaherpesvirus 1]ARE29824.1 capsid triplex subunit 1 [Canid alphaherpesvirus 1]
MDNFGNSFIQVGNGLRSYFNTTHRYSTNNGSNEKMYGQKLYSFNSSKKNTLDWLPGALNITSNSISIKNMSGVQISSSGIVNDIINLENRLWTPFSYQPYLRLTRHVTLTDFCNPQAEEPGLPILTLRHPIDLTSSAISSTPPGRNYQEVEEAWMSLLEVISGRGDGSGLRPSLLSINFLISSIIDDYPDRASAETVRAHVINNYGDRQIGLRLDRFGRCLKTMLRCHIFPHQAINVLGGLLSYISQDKLASITAIVRGVQEAGKTDKTLIPRSSVYIPACAFIDADRKLNIQNDGVKFVYLVFVYNQRLNNEGISLYIITSKLNSNSFNDVVSFLFRNSWTENVVRGTEGSNAPRPNPLAVFPLEELSQNPNSPRCVPSKLNDPQSTAALYQWQPDLRGRSNKNSCMFAAYMRIGVTPSESPKITRKTERFKNIEVPIVWIEGMEWDIDTWVECFY